MIKFQKKKNQTGAFSKEKTQTLEKRLTATLPPFKKQNP
jgi:hypothetical protein